MENCGDPNQQAKAMGSLEIQSQSQRDERLQAVVETIWNQVPGWEFIAIAAAAAGEIWQSQLIFMVESLG